MPDDRAPSDGFPSREARERRRRDDLQRAREDLLTDLKRETVPHWNVDFGRRKFPVPLASTGLSWVYVGIDFLAFCFGTVCVFFGPGWRELGIGLIVGAMFGVSTFVGQILATQLSVEEHQRDLLWRDSVIQGYAARLAEIDGQLSARGT